MGGDPVRDLKVEVAIDTADAAELDRLTGQLRRELLDLDVDDVQRAQEGTPPPGARGIDAAVLGGLIVSIGQAAGGLASVLAVIKNWVTRRPDRKVRLEIDGDVIELAAATAEQQERLADAWLARHG